MPGGHLFIDNIGRLPLVPPGPVAGPEMGRLEVLEQAAILVTGGKIAWFGPAADAPAIGGAIRLDAGDGCVIPGLVDCHTHTVFAGTREREFVQRIEGRSYAEIAESGGGIRVSVESVRAASEAELVELALPRLRRMLECGVTTVEIKSGYGLSPADELKMLRAIAALRERATQTIVATFLGAHTTPKEFAGKPDEYLDQVLAEAVLGEIERDGLAEFCDVFTERSAFDVDQSRRALLACKRHGMTPKVHADQITQMGASRLAAEVGAISADHLECIDDESIAAMKRAGTIAVLLPACSFFLGVDQAPARKIIQAGLPVAVATDFNPGSSMIESLPLAMGIAATQMRMTPTEILVAVTANAAAAIARQGSIGAIAEGHDADLLVLDVPSHERMIYEMGRNCVAHAIKAGEIVHSA